MRGKINPQDCTVELTLTAMNVWATFVKILTYCLISIKVDASAIKLHCVVAGVSAPTKVQRKRDEMLSASIDHNQVQETPVESYTKECHDAIKMDVGQTSVSLCFHTLPLSLIPPSPHSV